MTFNLHRYAPKRAGGEPLAWQDEGPIRIGDLAKLTFEIPFDDEWQTESLWVEVKRFDRHCYIGTLLNDSTLTEDIRSGAEVEFDAEHVNRIYPRKQQR